MLVRKERFFFLFMPSPESRGNHVDHFYNNQSCVPPKINMWGQASFVNYWMRRGKKSTSAISNYDKLFDLLESACVLGWYFSPFHEPNARNFSYTGNIHHPLSSPFIIVTSNIIIFVVVTLWPMCCVRRNSKGKFFWTDTVDRHLYVHDSPQACVIQARKPFS